MRDTLRAGFGVLRAYRYWIDACAVVLCLVVAHWVSPVLELLLVIASFGFLFEGVTAWFQRAGGTGGLRDGRQ
jgi:hypothetical protein